MGMDIGGDVSFLRLPRSCRFESGEHQPVTKVKYEVKRRLSFPGSFFVHGLPLFDSVRTLRLLTDEFTGFGFTSPLNNNN